MSNNITSSLQSILQQASTLKGKNRVGKHAQRLTPENASGKLLFLDVSGSMSESVGRCRKIDLLRKALDRPLHPGETAIAFHSFPETLVSLQTIPEPQGSTGLHLALKEGCKLRPMHTLVVSDGKPDDAAQALSVAEHLSGTISTLYIGADDDAAAIEFMQKLSRLGCGTADVCDLRRRAASQRLGSVIEQLLLSGS